MISAILKYSIGSLLYGGFITVLFLSLFIFLIKGWYKDAVFKTVSFVVLGLLALVVLWNSTIICGALAMKSDISSIRIMIEEAVETLDFNPAMAVDSLQSNEVLREVTARHPILNYYTDSCDFSGWSAAQLPAAMCDTLNDYLNGIILKSLIWCLGFVVVGAVIVIKTMDRRPVRRSASATPLPAGGRTGSGRVASRYGARHRTSRY